MRRLALHAAVALAGAPLHRALPGAGGRAAAADRLGALAAEALGGVLRAAWPAGPSAAWLRAHGGRAFAPEGFHAELAADARRPYFEGWYYRAALRPGNRSLAFVPGLYRPAGGGGFCFVMVADSAAAPARRARLYRYPLGSCGATAPRAGDGAWAFAVGPSYFSAAGLRVDLAAGSGGALGCETSGGERGAGCGTVRGALRHGPLQPLRPSLLYPSAMGWFEYLPEWALPCRHGVLSLAHAVRGELAVDGAPPAALAGRGYLEKDWGAAFPRAWLWLQCNTLQPPRARPRPAALLLSVAELPFPLPRWNLTSVHGLLAILWVPRERGGGGETWRFATYTGARLASLAAGRQAVEVVLRSATHSLRVTAARAPGTATARLWGPAERGFVPFIDEALDAAVSVELRRVADGSLVYAARGEGGALEDMLSG